ncbi:MAG: hypothetical protein WD768_00570 [Phycisphaeraceae bacterium]
MIPLLPKARETVHEDVTSSDRAKGMTEAKPVINAMQPMKDLLLVGLIPFKCLGANNDQFPAGREIQQYFRPHLTDEPSTKGRARSWPKTRVESCDRARPMIPASKDQPEASPLLHSYPLVVTSFALSISRELINRPRVSPRNHHLFQNSR